MKRQLLILALAAGLVGCSRPQKLSGTVTLDGKPLSGAAVILFPQEHGAETVVGMTDQNGRFIITPAAGRSIAYGTYKVVVSKREQLTPAQLNAFITPKELLPAKYSDLSQTVLSVNVTSAADIDLHLTR
jgi:phosphatidate phosphatase APP1